MSPFKDFIREKNMEKALAAHWKKLTKGFTSAQMEIAEDARDTGRDENPHPKGSKEAKAFIAGIAHAKEQESRF